MRRILKKENAVLAIVGLLTGIMSGAGAYGVGLLHNAEITTNLIIAIILGLGGGIGTFVLLVLLPEY